MKRERRLASKNAVDKGGVNNFYFQYNIAIDNGYVNR